jgi:hypothetical protein
MDPDIAASLAQFGTAGLVGWMWLTERRASVERERQLTEAHQRIVQERACFDVLVRAIQENTRVLAAVEAGQRSLAALLDRIACPATTPHE